jgi:hypothetical protein
MRRRQQRAQPQSGGSEYFDLVAAAERCVRSALDREELPPVNREPITDWLRRMSESRMK